MEFLRNFFFCVVILILLAFYIIMFMCLHDFCGVVLCLWVKLGGPGVLELMSTTIFVMPIME